MRILLYHTSRDLFYRFPEQWTTQPELADDFQSSAKAILLARERGLNGVDVFWDFGDPEYNVRLPIEAEPDETGMQEAA